MSWLARVRAQSVTRLTRFACLLALVALAMMSYSVVSPRPLPVILAMSVGHAIGGAAFLAYLLAVILDAAKSSSGRNSRAPEV